MPHKSRKFYLTPDAVKITNYLCNSDTSMKFCLYVQGHEVGYIDIDTTFLSAIVAGDYEEYDGDEQFIPLPTTTRLTFDNDYDFYSGEYAGDLTTAIGKLTLFEWEGGF